MEDNRYNRNYGKQMYVDGNTVRRLEEPAERPVRRPERRPEPRVTSASVRRNREKVQRISIPYLLLLMGACAAVLFICVNYLQAQSGISTHRKQIQNLESSLQTLKSNNAAAQDQIENYLDLEHIYEVATGELGMVYPSDDQVIYFDKTESGYVRQYEDIPTD